MRTYAHEIGRMLGLPYGAADTGPPACARRSSDDATEAPVPAKRIRRLAAVSAGDELEDALAALRRTGAHLARVVDAEGATTGVLFLEDILEELVGEVQDATNA